MDSTGRRAPRPPRLESGINRPLGRGINVSTVRWTGASSSRRGWVRSGSDDRADLGAVGRLYRRGREVLPVELDRRLRGLRGSVVGNVIDVVPHLDDVLSYTDRSPGKTRLNLTPLGDSFGTTCRPSPPPLGGHSHHVTDKNALVLDVGDLALDGRTPGNPPLRWHSPTTIVDPGRTHGLIESTIRRDPPTDSPDRLDRTVLFGDGGFPTTVVEVRRTDATSVRDVV